jgi:hypothetical protein
MSRISAASNLTIEMQADRWRLLVNGNADETVLVEAISGQPLRYLPRFGNQRRLPDSGSLPVTYIQRVVLGWSTEDEAWHLGLVLEPSLAQARGSRWCEIAHWPDPETSVFADIAAQAGQTLARTITRPFNLIPPRSTPVIAPPPPLPELPLQFDTWTFERSDQDQLQFRRVSGWARGRLIRILWYTLWIAVYVVLSVTTLQGTIALPSPEFLPFLGIAAALILVGMSGHILYQLLASPNRMVVSSSGVAGMKGDSERWQVNPTQVRSVYVTQVVNKKGKKRSVQHGELNLLLQDGTFQHLFDQGQTVSSNHSDDGAANVMVAEALTPLRQADVYTDLQAAGMYIAQSLNVPCIYDRRVKG